MDSDELPNLADWRNVEAWTLEEAAMLWAAIDPFDHLDVRLKDLGNKVSSIRRRKAMIYQRAAVEAVCAGTLPFVVAKEWHEDFNGNQWENTIGPQNLPDRDTVRPHRTVVKQAAFMKWTQSKGIKSYRQIHVRETALNVVVTQAVAVPSPVLPNHSHPRAPTELIVGIEVWGEISGADYIDGTSPNPKQVARRAIENHPLGKNLTAAAKDRVSTSANWKQGGGCPKTPGE